MFSMCNAFEGGKLCRHAMQIIDFKQRVRHRVRSRSRILESDCDMLSYREDFLSTNVVTHTIMHDIFS